MVMLEPPQDVLQLLRDALGDSSADAASAANNETEEILAYVATLASSLTDSQNFHSQEWVDALSPYLASLPHLASDETQCEEAVEKFRCAAENSLMQNDDSSDEEDEFGGEQITDIRFSLAYGGKILLHQTKLRLRRGHRYALVGQNGVGKTTLMNAIQNGKLEGWPVDLRTEYVDSGSNVDPVHEAKIVFTDLQKTSGKSEEDCKAMLGQLKFTPDMMKGTIGELSGGWQMKLRLAQAVLIDADILLLDEPTNHLDTKTVQWLKDYLTGLTNTTVLIVSHDTPFLEEVVSDVIHYEQRPQWGPHRKLVHYAGKMSAFVKKQPQAKHYFELATTDLKFVFPEPGRLEGIRTSTQRFLEMENVNYRYPGADHDTLGDINLKMTLSSRVCLIGANGAGKTTLVKMIVGDTQPSNPTECRLFIHHNLRVAYVSQHAFYHVEQHIEDSPCSYIQWRFKDGFDKEKIESEAFRITPEEQKAIDDYNLEGIWSRRLRAGVLEYEIKKKHVREKDNIYVSKDELLAMGFKHLLRQTDEKIASKEAGLDLRPVTTSEIQTHLDDFGLAQEFGTYGKIRGLSGGQKVKLVLAAAMWNCPHLLVLDEPTNYLDREALGALSAALNEWGGAVLMISHNKEFYGSVCKEEWIVADGKVDVKGDSDEREMKAVARKKESKKEKSADAIVESAGGNTNADGDKYKDATTNFWGKAVSKKEARNYDKAKKKGDVAAMRKILAIPKGKVMPGQEELGDGK
uniref:ABC transporter domain-containing protein n=1 Tax=Skeletonema marinoi TaxID=267567 RepID=A0A7S2M5Z9_9STRA|mmetsp:Transcript_4818/g.8282  ORF Transcript_4818/g.8282 Transcript_4818/m.8282 type:complete len:744 (+) Transcript_4818:28-2259(+)